MAKFNKVLRHPDREDIIKKFIDGSSLKDVETWLKKKYPRKKRLHISWVTLQKFRKEHLNLHGEVLDDIKNARSDKKKVEDSNNLKDIVSSSSHYQDKINEIADGELDATRRLLELDKLIESRLEYYFNLMASGNSMSTKEEKILLEYIREMRALLADWKKFVEGVADKKVEHNININVVNEQLNVIKGVVFEVLKELDPKLIPLFVDKLNYKMEDIHVGTESYKKLGVIDAQYEEYE